VESRANLIAFLNYSIVSRSAVLCSLRLN